MARGLHQLSARGIAALVEPGRYSDGGGLVLLVRKRGPALERLWMFRYKRGRRGALREISLSLGPARDVTLASARSTAALCRAALAEGRDPRDVISGAGNAPTFETAANDFIETLAPSLRNKKHVAQWRMTLGKTYCGPILPRRVDRVSTEDVLAVLKPIWHAKPETASRIRGRIERVLDGATVKGQRQGANPAQWKGHLEHLLPKPQKLRRGHHKALPWRDIPTFMERLRSLESVSALALEWTILTAARTSETVGAEFEEIDEAQRVWLVPGDRMKSGRPHRVPLSGRCMEILETAKKLGGDGWMFPSTDPRDPLSSGAMSECLKGLVGTTATVHGFRSTFRDWVGEATSYSEHLAEAALAHVIQSKTERAYRRGDALDRRRELMAAWERYCSPRAGNVVAFKAG